MINFEKVEGEKQYPPNGLQLPSASGWTNDIGVPYTRPRKAPASSYL